MTEQWSADFQQSPWVRAMRSILSNKTAMNGYDPSLPADSAKALPPAPPAA